MKVKIKRKDIVDHMDIQMDEWLCVLDKRTGDIIDIDEHYLRIAEESEVGDTFGKYRDWEKESIREALDLLEHEESYIALPSKWDIHEYSIMERFCWSLDNKTHQEKLERAITGRGAFRRFKDTIAYLGIEDQWYDFKDKHLMKIAEDWCKDHGLDYE